MLLPVVVVVLESAPDSVKLLISPVMSSVSSRELVSLPMVVDVLSPDARTVNLFVEGPTPDWSLPVPKLLEPSPPGVKRFAFQLDGVPPGVNPEGAALKLTLVGGDRSYEFNINLE